MRGRRAPLPSVRTILAPASLNHRARFCTNELRGNAVPGMNGEAGEILGFCRRGGAPLRIRRSSRSRILLRDLAWAAVTTPGLIHRVRERRGLLRTGVALLGLAVVAASIAAVARLMRPNPSP